MKNAEERMDVIAAYREVGTFRGAAVMCGTTHKTVKRIVTRQLAGDPVPVRVPRGHNYDPVAALVAARVEKTSGRITAKRLLPQARVEGYTGSARNFRRLVSAAKKRWARGHHRGRRPGVWAPGDTLVIDWGVEGGLHVFCAVLAWSRFRFVRFAADERSATTLSMLADCFEVLGGVPKVVLADRMGCLKGGVVADVVVPTADYVRFATHYGFRPDFCQGHDPESKGIVENLVGYAKRDLLVPQAPFDGLVAANAAAAAWCGEVNAVSHSEICAVPADRLATERPLLGGLPSLRPRLGRVVTRKVDRLSCVRFASGRYSVPTQLIGTVVEVACDACLVRIVDPVSGQLHAEHALVAPGEASIVDDHYGGPRPDRPARTPRAKTATETAFLALGPAAAPFVSGAAAAGVTKLAGELADIVALADAHGDGPVAAALERAVAFRRWRAGDVRSILAAGSGVPIPTQPGQPLTVDLPQATTRSLDAYAHHSQRPTT